MKGRKPPRGSNRAVAGRDSARAVEMTSLTITYSPPGDEEPLVGYFISPSGSDSTGAGTEASPWLTLQKFIDAAPAAGSTLYLRGGTYANHATSTAGYYGKPALTGTESAPITIRNYPGETPLFSGGSEALLGLAQASYVVLDGFQITNRNPGASGQIYAGAWYDEYLAHHITLRNLYMNLPNGTDNHGHCFYPSKGTSYITMEDCVLVGPGNGTAGAGFHHYHSPSLRYYTIQRNVFKDFNAVGSGVGGVVIYDSDLQPVPDGVIRHNSFINCRLVATYHGDLDFDDNAFTAASKALGVYDPNHSSYTTDGGHNFYGQTFDANYYLTSGQTGRSAASDGTDAGALDW